MKSHWAPCASKIPLRGTLIVNLAYYVCFVGCLLTRFAANYMPNEDNVGGEGFGDGPPLRWLSSRLPLSVVFHQQRIFRTKAVSGPSSKHYPPPSSSANHSGYLLLTFNYTPLFL